MAAQTDSPPENKDTTKTAEKITEESTESKPAIFAVPNSPKKGPKVETPLPPILSMGKKNGKEELEKYKIVQQNYILTLNENLLKSKNALRRTENYIANLEKAYEQAKESGNPSVAQNLAKNIKQAQASIKTLDRQKDHLQEYILEANKKLRDIHEQLEKADSHAKPSASKSAALASAVGGFLLGGAIISRFKKKQQEKLSSEEFDKKFKEAQGEQQLRERFGLPKPQKIFSPAEFKQKFNTHLAQQGLSNLGKNAPPVFNPAAKLNTSAMKSPFGVLKSLKNISQTFKNTLKNLKTIIKTIRTLTTSATGVGAIVNLALLLKDIIAKIRKYIAIAIAGVGTMLALLWLWLLAKIAGILAGAAFGLVTGIPLLFVPAVGPFLYAGWVGYWTWKGWTDPIATIHLATHPWEIITRPLNWLGDQFSGLGGGIKGGTEVVAGGIGNATGGLISTAGSFVTGTASALWGGLTGAAGGVISTAGSIAGSIWGGLTGAGSAIAGNVVQVAVGSTVASAAGLTIASTMMTNSAFYTQDLDVQEQIFPPGQNELFSITKTVNPAQIRKPDTLEQINVAFTVSINPAQPLSNLTLTDNITTTDSNSDGYSSVNNCPTTIATLNSPTTCTITLTVNTNQDDGTTITNTIQLTATSSGDPTKTETDTASATVRVGNVPAGCPRGWPATGPITQGPEGGTSHAAGSLSPTDPGYEAIDIGKGTKIGDPIYSTFEGTVVNIWQRNNLDQRVEIAPINCPGLSFGAYWHNSEILVSLGQTVNYGQIIARSGAYVTSTGPVPHLHYQFNASGDRSFPMEEPYIPDDSFGRTCSNDFGCGVTITVAP